VRELYQETIRETSLNITRWTIDSIRKKNITKSGCRIFRDSFIGVAGTLGEPTDLTWQEAEANLAEQIPYPYILTTGAKRDQDLREEDKDPQTLTAEIESCLAVCRERYPNLVLSNKVNLMEVESRLTNDEGTDLRHRDQFTVIALLVKHIDSVNVFDSILETVYRRFDRERFLKYADDKLGAFEKEAAMPKGEKPLVIISQSEVLRKLQEELSGKKMGRGASIFTGKTGRPLFGEHFTLYRDATEDAFGEAFFDMEGTTLPNDKMVLIEKGVIKAPYADKKNAADFGLALTASAGGAYDDVPTLDSRSLSIASSGRTLKELLQGETGIYVVVTAGGDFTSEGLYAAPVQMAMLTDGERMIGRLPAFSISGSIYDMFGHDFVGVASDTPFNHEHLAVIRMKAAES